MTDLWRQQALDLISRIPPDQKNKEIEPLRKADFKSMHTKNRFTKNNKNW